MLAYGSVLEKIAVLSDHEDIFVHTCAPRPGPERFVW
jgi:hypothetical protein